MENFNEHVNEDKMCLSCNISSSYLTKHQDRFDNRSEIMWSISNPESLLERSIGFLLIGSIGIISNLFVIIILGSSAEIRQK